MAVDKKDKALERFLAGINIVKNHPLFEGLLGKASVVRTENSICPKDGYAVVASNGVIYTNYKMKAEPEQWAYIIAHCLLHLAFNHFKDVEDKVKWNMACDLYITNFLRDMKFGKSHFGFEPICNFQSSSEEKIYNYYLEMGVPEGFEGFGVAGRNSDFIKLTKNVKKYSYYYGRQLTWEELFAIGLSKAVTSAVNVAGGYQSSLNSNEQKKSIWTMAREWFINKYPLLGALASSFAIVEDLEVCRRMDISIAAISASMKEIYINPSTKVNLEEAKFIIAHELLHVGLAHDERCQGRDPYLWNVACDYVINDWLLQMDIGELPKLGLLYDIDLRGMSAEGIYDVIVKDIRKYRKLATLRGTGMGDILPSENNSFWKSSEGVTLEEFYKRALREGLQYHKDNSRGYLPSGLIEEINALSQPPIKWDVKLANWFDYYFNPLEKERTYSRVSRRQGSTPDIPRASWIKREINGDSRTYGVILDTSGSMDRILLAKALGTIISYSLSRDVSMVRVIFCDAVPYDEGYVRPEDIAYKVKVKGRGGTVLQSAVDYLESQKDFPKTAPILIITDGECDSLRIRNEYGVLLPKGARLPFTVRGKVFYMD